MGIVTTSYLEMRKKEILDECKFFPLSDEATELRKRIAEVDMVDTDRGLEQIARISLEFSMLGHKSEDLDDVLKYFDVMCKDERNLVKEWCKKQNAKTWNQSEFLVVVREAIQIVNYNYLIANIEPSIDKKGNIYYSEGHKVAEINTVEEWERAAKEFLPEHDSSLATLYELFLWYAYRIAKGFWTLEYVCDDSIGSGNSWISPNSSHDLEVSGAREIGGAREGFGNTHKLVKKENNFVFCGETSYEKQVSPYRPVAFWFKSIINSTWYSTGVIVLRK